MTHRWSSGLTLIEVLVALVILGAAIVGLVQLQGASLGYTKRAEHLRTVTQIAEAEVEWLRQTHIDPTRTECQTYVPPGYTCEVETNIHGFMGYYLNVHVWAPGTDPDANDPDITLQTFTTGQRYVTGIAPTAGFEVEEPTGPPPSGGETPADDEEDTSGQTPCTGGQGKGKGQGKGGC